MNAMPGPASLASQVPQPIYATLVHSRDMAVATGSGLSVISTILSDALRQARESDGLDTDAVECLRDQIEWVLDQLQQGCSELRWAVRDTGALPERS